MPATASAAANSWTWTRFTTLAAKKREMAMSKRWMMRADEHGGVLFIAPRSAGRWWKFWGRVRRLVGKDRWIPLGVTTEGEADNQGGVTEATTE
jgi:hypothetical protein